MKKSLLLLLFLSYGAYSLPQRDLDQTVERLEHNKQTQISVTRELKTLVTNVEKILKQMVKI